MMDRDDTLDLTLALAIGLAAGIGAVLLLRGGSPPRRPLLEQGRDETRRLLDELRPLRRQVHRRFEAVRDAVAERARR
jgi:hypothetical protein